VLAVGSAVAAAPPQGWHDVPAGKAQGVFPLGFASGRLWFVIEDVRGNDLLQSARVGSAGLSSVVSTQEGQNPWLASAFIVGSSLVILNGNKGSLIEPLLSTGTPGTAVPIPGDPEKTASDAFAPKGTVPDSWLARAGVTVGGRTIWAINGHSCPNGGPHRCTQNGGGYSSLAICCTAAGEASDLTALLANPTKAGAAFMSMGIDTHHRVWLAWIDGAKAHQPISPVTLRLVQIDPATLKARSTKSLNTQVFAIGTGATSITLACTDTCRVVYENSTGISSWGGDGPATRILANDRRRDTGGHLLGAASGGSSLRIAYYADKTPNVPDDGQRLVVARGDPRGRNLHATASVDIPRNLPAGGTQYLYPTGVALSMFTPTADVGLGVYVGSKGSRVLAAVLHG
jgi:hypothetical protein